MTGKMQAVIKQARRYGEQMTYLVRKGDMSNFFQVNTAWKEFLGQISDTHILYEMAVASYSDGCHAPYWWSKERC